MSMTYKRVFLSAILLIALLLPMMAGCTPAIPAATSTSRTTVNTTPVAATPAPTTSLPYAQRTVVKVATIQGPSGIGMSQLMEKNEKRNTLNQYNFIVEPSSQNIASLVISGEVDIACVPTNLAATLYNKMTGGVRLIAINTLGVLHIIENGDTVKSVEDLSGKTLHVSGKGTVPQYAIEYILKAYGLADKVNIVYYADHDELAALAASGAVSLCMLPEPKVTAVLSQNPAFRLSIDVTKAWGDAAKKNGDTGSVLTMGGVIVRSKFLQDHPDAVADFLEEYEASIDFVVNNVTAASVLVEKFAIMPKAAVAAKAIPNCNIVYIDGEEMATSLGKLLEVLFASNPQSIGGQVPAKDFYHIG